MVKNTRTKQEEELDYEFFDDFREIDLEDEVGTDGSGDDIDEDVYEDCVEERRGGWIANILHRLTNKILIWIQKV